MSYVTDTLKQPLDILSHSDPGTEFVTGNDVSLNPDRNFRSGLAASYNDDRIAQSAGIDQDRYMHIGELAAGAAALFFGGSALANAGASAGGAGAGTVGGDAGAATAGGGVADGGVGTAVGDAGAGDLATGATGTSLVGDAGGEAGSVAAGGGDAGAATAGGGTGGAASSGFDLAGYAHKAATYLSLYNTAASIANAKKAQGMGGVPATPPLKYQDPNAPDMAAIRKKNSLLFGDDSPSSTDLTKGKASTGNLGKAQLLGS